MTLEEQIREAFYSKLNVADVTNIATGGVFTDESFLGAAKPFLIIEITSSKRPEYAFGFTALSQEFLVTVRVHSDKDSSTTKSPQRLNDEAIEAVEMAIGQDLELSEGACEGVMRDIYLTIDDPRTDKNVKGKGVRFVVLANNDFDAIDDTYYLTVGGEYLTVGGEPLRLQ